MSQQPIGPSLPPGWTRPQSPKQNNHKEEDNQLIGPALPPNYKLNNNDNSDSYSNTNTDTTSDRIIGPQIPIHLRTNASNEDNSSESDSDDEVIGPIPESHKDYHKHDSRFINSPSISFLNQKKETEKQVTKREEWMTEIPKPLARKLGMKSVHQFSQRSSKNVDLKPESNEEKYSNEIRNKEMTELMDDYNKRNKRDVSLLDIHAEKRKKAKSEDKCKERVPFDPEKDLSVRKLDSKQTKSIIDKAKGFSDRFSQGTNKFL